MIKIDRIKKEFIEEFPQHPLSKILKAEKNEISEEEFLAKAVTWLLIIESFDSKEWGES